MDNTAIKEADRIYGSLKNVLNNMLDEYDKDDEERTVEFYVKAKPFDFQLRAIVVPEHHTLNLYSTLQFEVTEEHRSSYSMAICQLNYDEMFVGNYDFNTETGKTVFRLSVIYQSSLISNELVESALRCAYSTVTQKNEFLFKASRSND